MAKNKEQIFIVKECNYNEDTNFYTLKLLTETTVKGVFGDKTTLESFWINGLKQSFEIDSEHKFTIGVDYDVEERPYTAPDERTGEMTTSTMRWLVPVGTARTIAKVDEAA